MAVVTAAETFERGEFRFTPLAVPSRGAAELAVWLLEVPAGARGERHSPSREEVFVLNAGQMAFEVDGVEQRLGVGEAMIIAAEQEFALWNPGDEVARVTVCTSKGIRGRLADGTTVEPPWAR